MRAARPGERKVSCRPVPDVPRGDAAAFAPPLAEVPLPAPDVAALLRAATSSSYADRPALRFGDLDLDARGAPRRSGAVRGPLSRPGSIRAARRTSASCSTTRLTMSSRCAAPGWRAWPSQASTTRGVGEHLARDIVAHRPAARDHRAAAPGAARRGPRRRRSARRRSGLGSLRRRRRPALARRTARRRARGRPVRTRRRRQGRGTAPGRRRRRRPVGVAVHVRDVGRAEGRALHPAPPAHHRQPDGHDARAESGRRRLRGHAAVPHQLVDVRPRRGAGRRRVAVPGPSLQRVAVPPRRSPLRRDVVQLHRQGARPTCWPRRPVPTTPTIRSGSPSATRGRRTSSKRRPSASA